MCKCRHAIFVRRQCPQSFKSPTSVPALCSNSACQGMAGARRCDLSEDATLEFSMQDCVGPKREGLRVAQLRCLSVVRL